MIYLITAAVIDIKTKKVPNQLIRAGFYIDLIYLLLLLWQKENVSILVPIVGKFIFLSVLLCVFFLCTKGRLGAGDVKLLLVLSIPLTLLQMYFVIAFASVAGIFVFIIGFITKKLSRKDSIPFVPCIMAGTILCYFLI